MERADPATAAAVTAGNLTAPGDDDLPAWWRTRSRQRALAWLLLVLSLAATVLAWNTARERIDGQIQARNEEQLTQMQARLQRSFSAYEALLRASAVYVRAAEEIDSATWTGMVGGMSLQENFPGLEGLGFAISLPAGQKANHEEMQRRRLQSDYGIRPLGSRSFYAPLDYYLRTAKGRGPGAGYDMYAEPVRRAAMERARHTMRTSVSDPVLLVANSGEPDQVGLVMFVPVTRKNVRTDSAELAALLGWVCAPIRMDTLIASIITSPDSVLGVRISDPAKNGKNQLVYADQEAQALTSTSSVIWSRGLRLDLGDRHWILQLAFAAPAVSAGDPLPELILAGGTLLSCLLFAVVMILMTARVQTLGNARAVNNALRLENGELRASLQQQTLQLQTVLAASPFAIMMFGAQKIDWINQAGAAMLGYAPAQLMGQSTRMLFDSDAAWQASMTQMASALALEHAPHLERELLGQDGRRLTCAGTVMALDVTSHRRGLIAVFQDMGQSRHQQALLEQTRQFSHALFDLAPIGLALAHLDGRMISVNRQFAELFGMTQAQVLDCNYWNLIPIERGEFEKMHRDPGAGEGQSTRVEKQVQHSDGRVRPVRLQLQVTHRLGEAVICTAAENIANEKAVEQRIDACLLQIEDQQRRLAEHERSKLDMLANVSQDLTTPLNAIVGFSELLVDGIPEPLAGEQKEYASHILTASRELLDLIRVIVIFSSNGTTPAALDQRLHVDVIDVRAFMVRRLEGFKAMAEKKALTFGLRVEVGGQALLAEREYLRIITDSLLEHAVRFAPCDSKVNVSAMCVHRRTVSANGDNHSDQRWLEVWVQDDAPVPDMAIHGQLSDRTGSAMEKSLAMLDGGSADAGSGGSLRRGLDLPLALKLAAYLGGAIEIENLAGMGTRFIARIPWREPEQKAG